jgi:sugar lactone lactonase YvrE
MKTKLITLAGLFWAVIIWAQTADDHIAQGRTYLEAHDVWAANSQFTAALTLSPTNETANALLAVTRILVIPQTPAGSNFLNQLGFAKTNRDIYNWMARMPEDTNGQTLFPAGYNSLTAVSFFRTNVMAVLAASATNLANIKSAGFSLSLSASETSIQAVTLDYGDIQLLRALLAGVQFAGYTINAQNLSVVIPTLQKMEATNGLTIQSVLAAYPNLLKLTNSADLAASKAALTNVIARYLAASDFIRNLRAPDAVRLFNLDTNDVVNEADFRRDTTNFLASLSGPAILDPNLTFSLNASNYFSGAKTLRSLVPQFRGNYYVANTLPDYTFGGILLNEPACDVESALRDEFGQKTPAGIYTGWVNDNYVGGWAGEFALFIGTNGQANLVGYDNYYSPGGCAAQFKIPDFGYWDFSSNSVSGSGYVSDNGHFDAQLDFINGMSVWVEGWKTSPMGGYQNVAGFYSGSWSGFGGLSGKLWGILDAVGDVYFINYQPDGSLDDGGQGYFDFEATNSFYGYSAESSEVVGTLNRTTSTLSGAMTNVYGNGTFTMTRSARVPFDPPPAITAAPINLAVAVGSNATFRVTATGSPPLCYQWYCNNAPIPGAVTNTLTLAGVSLALNGNIYSVSVRNVAGGTGAAAMLTVADATKPAITNVNLAAGQRVSNAVFTVTGRASDNSGVAAVWYQLNNGNWMPVSTTNSWTNWWADLALVTGTNVLRTYAVDRSSRSLIYVADNYNNLIRRISPSGVVTTLAGDVNNLTNGNPNAGFADGLGGLAAFNSPTVAAVDKAGNVFVADTGNNLIRKITPGGLVTTLAGDTNSLASGFADGSGAGAMFSGPTGLAVDDSGNVYVSDSENNLIRRITPDGAVSTVAGNVYDLTNGYYYGNAGFADGPGETALFSNPTGLAVDRFGNLYVADSGNNLIRKITPDGTVTTLAGDVYTLTNDYYSNNSGFADGEGGAARFNYPVGVAVDFAGNVFVADSQNHLIRTINPDGWVSTLAGNTNGLPEYPSYGYADGVGSAAKFNFPLDVAADNFGNVFVTDYQNNLVRRVTPAGAVTTFAGDVYDLANNNFNGGFGNGTGSSVKFYGPMGLRVDNAGGNISPTNSISFVYVVSGGLQVQLVGQGSLSPNYSNAVLEIGKGYSMTVVPTNGFAFSSWTLSTNWLGGVITNRPTVQFVMASNLTLLATLVDTNRPALSILSPTNNQRWSNSAFVVTGTARDNVRVSNVWLQVNSTGWQLATLSGNRTNWSANVNLNSGTNILQAFAEDSVGNVSTNATAKLIYVLSGVLQVQTVGLGTISPNYSNAMLQLGQNYSLTAAPRTGFTFLNWMVSTNWLGGLATNSATVQFMMTSNLTLTATFADTNRPTLSITNLTAGQRISNSLFSVKGTATDNWRVAGVYYQLNDTGWTNAGGTTNWSGPLILRPGTNQMSAYAADNTGNRSLTNTIKFQFVVPGQLQVRMAGLGTITPNYSNAWLEIGRNYSLTATQASGFMFTNWTFSTNWTGGALTNNRTAQFMMASNLTLLVSFVDTNKPSLLVSSPAAGQKMTNALARVIGTASDNWKVTGVWYQLNSGDWNIAGTTNNFTNWNKTLTLLAGTNTIKAYAQDLGGNYSLTNTLNIVASNTFKLQLAISNVPVGPNGLAFNLQISPGLSGQIQVSTNLSTWTILTNFTGGITNVNLRDAAATNFNSRFYRAVIP